MQPTLEALQGTIERITYHNPENGYCVLKVKVKGHFELVTVVGHINKISTGELIESKGQWAQHRDFGMQFKADELKSTPPSTLEGIEKYLGSGIIKGIGSSTASKLVEKFKEKIFEIIEEYPDRLRQIPGIGASRVKTISKAWQEQKAVREIMVFLQSHGVGTARAVRIYKIYGAQAIEKVKENPYQLARDIHGIGFKSADSIAQHLGIPKDSLIRAQAGLHYTLQETVGNGHCAYPVERLIEDAKALLEIDPSILEQALELEIGLKAIILEKINGTSCAYPFSLFKCEGDVAKLFKRLEEMPRSGKKFPVLESLARVEKELGIELAALQRQAVEQSFESKVLVITGGPGTGKTTLTRSIVTLLRAQNTRIGLCSPTGRAAKRLSECTKMEAKTIHRLLGFDPVKNRFLYDEDNPLPFDFLLVDEVSMVDLPLMSHLLKAIPPHASFVLVGDEDQLPSVGPGAVLKSLIDSGTIPVVRLTQIFRQSAESRIIQAAHEVRKGSMPDFERSDKTSDFHFISVDDPESAMAKIIELVTDRIPKAYGLDPLSDIQVLCPMHKGTLGSRNLNLELQKALNPKPSAKLERFGVTFAVNDKVMVISNDYDKEVFNGDIGKIYSIDGIEQEVVIEFDGRKVLFDFTELDLITLAYSISIHKSQGSEYPAVVIPLTTQHYSLLKRNLIYTAITRGKKLVILIGQKKALGIAVHSSGQETRWNNLAERLKSSATEKAGRRDPVECDLSNIDFS